MRDDSEPRLPEEARGDSTPPPDNQRQRSSVSVERGRIPNVTSSGVPRKQRKQSQSQRRSQSSSSRGRSSSPA